MLLRVVDHHLDTLADLALMRRQIQPERMGADLASGDRRQVIGVQRLALVARLKPVEAMAARWHAAA